MTVDDDIDDDTAADMGKRKNEIHNIRIFIPWVNMIGRR